MGDIGTLLLANLLRAAFDIQNVVADLKSQSKTIHVPFQDMTGLLVGPRWTAGGGQDAGPEQTAGLQAIHVLNFSRVQPAALGCDINSLPTGHAVRAADFREQRNQRDLGFGKLRERLVPREHLEGQGL